MIPKLKSEGYTRDGIRLYPMDGGGGGGGSAVQQQTSIQELPEWAKPYAQKTLAKAEALTDINQNPYQTYQNERIAGFSPLQQQAQQQAAGMAPAAQLGTATGMATQAGLQGLGAAYQPGYFGNQFRAPGQYTPSQFSMLQAQAPSLQDYQMQAPADVQSQQLQQYQMGPAQQVGTQSYTGENVGQYMSPYMQNVVDIQKREAQRASGILGTQQAGQAVQAGAFGGSRAGLLEAERQRNLATQMGDIQATGQQAAFQNAQQQFNAQQQANLQAALANQQAGLTTGQQNLAALLGVQQLGAGQNLQAALANQQAGLATGQQNLAARLGIQQLGAGQNLQAQLANQQALQQAQQAAEQSRQYGYGQQMTAAQQRAQYGLSGQQLGEQSRQYGAGLGMQGANLGLQAAGTLGGLGQSQYQQGMGINQLQNQYGAQQQALQQQGLTQAYQDFLNQQNYPYRQLGFMSDLIRGLPLGQQSTAQVYQPTTALQNIGALGLGAYGMKQLGMFAEGGKVDGYADGGMTVMDKFNDPEAMLAEMDKMTEAQLQAIIKAPTTPAEAEAAKRELAMRASERQGLAGAFNKLPYPTRAQFAGGGIIAFKDEGLVSGEEDAPTSMYNYISGPADPRLLKAAEERISAMDEFAPTTVTPEQMEQIRAARLASISKQLGPNVAAQGLQDYLKNADTDRGAALQQGKGLAALAAMEGITQPGGLIRGLGSAGRAFAQTYGKALEADRLEKRSLAMAKFNLADADRKERMGLMKEADAAETAYRSSLKDANKFNFDKLRYGADASVKLAQASRQHKAGAGGAGGSEKEFQFAMKQYLPDTQRQFPGLSDEEHRALAFERYQKNKSAGLEGVTTRTESNERVTAAANARKRAYSDPAWQTATRNKDKAALAAREAELFTEELGKLQPGATGGSGRGGAGGGGSGNNDPLGLRR